MRLLLRWAVGAISLYITILIAEKLNFGLSIIPGLNGVMAVVAAVALLSIINALIRPILKMLTLPLTCLTLGLFSFVLNALLFWGSLVLVNVFIPAFKISSFIGPLFGAIAWGIISGILNMLLISENNDKKR